MAWRCVCRPFVYGLILILPIPVRPPAPASGVHRSGRMAPEERWGLMMFSSSRVRAECQGFPDKRRRNPSTIRRYVVGLRKRRRAGADANKLRMDMSDPQVSGDVKEWRQSQVSGHRQLQKPVLSRVFPQHDSCGCHCGPRAGLTPIAENSVTLRREVKGTVESENCSVLISAKAGTACGSATRATSWWWKNVCSRAFAR